MFKNLEIIFACAGDGKRWNNYNNTQKHLVNMFGKPLLQFNIEKFDKLFNLETYTVSIKCEEEKQIYNIHGKIKFYAMNENNNLEFPALYNLKKYILESEKDVLVVLGDVVFSNKCLEIVYNAVKKGEYAIFGRIGKSKICDYGELFSFYIPTKAKNDFYLCVEIPKIFYERKILRRFICWEIILFIESIGGMNKIHNVKKEDFDIILKKMNIYTKIIYSEQSNAIKINNFFQINDSTEDFDFPADYIKWMECYGQ